MKLASSEAKNATTFATSSGDSKRPRGGLTQPIADHRVVVGSALLWNRAETRRFELLKGLTPYLVSSEGMRFVLTLVYACLGSLHGD